MGTARMNTDAGTKRAFTGGRRASKEGVEMSRSPHGPTTVVTPLLGSPINVHLFDFSPGNRTVDQANVATRSADFGGGGATGVGVRGVGLQHGPVFSVRGKALPITG